MFNKKKLFVATILLMGMQPFSYAPIIVNNNSSDKVTLTITCEGTNAIDTQANPKFTTHPVIKSGKKNKSIRMLQTKCTETSITKLIPTLTLPNGTVLKNSDAQKSSDYQGALHINDGDTINITDNKTYAIVKGHLK